MIPRAKISVFSSASPFSTSGAKYRRVPLVSARSCLVKSATPKSMTLITETGEGRLEKGIEASASSFPFSVFPFPFSLSPLAFPL